MDTGNIRNARRGTGIDEDLAGGHGDRALSGGDFHAMRAGEVSAAGDYGDVVLVGELVIVLVAQHRSDAALLLDSSLEHCFAGFGSTVRAIPPRLFGGQNQ